ncbi:HAMP domain-containing sensor histidine kinase [Acidocella sp.]|uniref:sensor histidine kinase n=1 Tax=Acidocella sp. TaxID=50710 RepID=UPI002623F0D8|nr:HAMP domain-containing sensor histidine kinase [Acidocella sp.]
MSHRAQMAGTDGAAGEPRRLRPFIRSAGVRFAVAYALVFGVSAFILAFSIWYSTLGLLQHQVEAEVRADEFGLLEHEGMGGLGALSVAIANRMADAANVNAIYLLVDPTGRPVVGNLDSWPRGLTGVQEWYELPVQRQGVASVALMRATMFPDGSRLLVGRDVQARSELRLILRDALIWAFGIMVALGAFGALLIRSLFRRIIQDVAETTRAIARGELSRRVPVSGVGDEFDELAVVINDMLERLGRLMDGVRQVSNAIAHDLRTPVARARARLEDAALHAHTPETMSAAIERAISDLDGITGIFEALLRISEIEAGSRRAAFAAVDLAPMLHDMDELYAVVAEERGLKLDSSIHGPLPVIGDRQLVQQAVANLLDNALKFSPMNGVIRFQAQRHEQVVEIVVADRGPGIPENERARATERFYRGEAARHTQGSGLGLSLVAAVAQLHGGTLYLGDNHAPDEPNTGLRAVLVLPANVPPPKFVASSLPRRG